MEESAQRKERLKAMRMEASREAATYNGRSEHSDVSLSNPLLESTASNLEAQVHSSFARSFNYYTDPMSAFSGNKQKSNVSPQISQDSSSTPQRSRTNETFPSPSLQAHVNQSPNPIMQQERHYANPHYTCTPQGGSFPSQSFDYQGRSWNSNSPRLGYRGPGSVGIPSPVLHHSPQPHFIGSPGHGGYPSPHFNNSLAYGSGRGYPSPGPNFHNSPNHGLAQGGYPSQGRRHWSGNSRSTGPSSERGKGPWSGQGRGRGGYHNHVSAEDRPDLFYNKSMVEDPWKSLEPVIYKSHKKTSLPHSLSAKKPGVSESPR